MPHLNQSIRRAGADFFLTSAPQVRIFFTQNCQDRLDEDADFFHSTQSFTRSAESLGEGQSDPRERRAAGHESTVWFARSAGQLGSATENFIPPNHTMMPR